MTIQLFNHLEIQCVNYIEISFFFAFNCRSVLFSHGLLIHEHNLTGNEYLQKRKTHFFLWKLYTRCDISFLLPFIYVILNLPLDSMHSTILFLVCLSEAITNESFTNRSGFIFDVMNFSSHIIFFFFLFPTHFDLNFQSFLISLYRFA